jgi:glycosyltransferase involved in cell wall biosynthesis
VTARRVLQVLGQSAGGVGRHVAEVTRALDDGDRLVVDVAAPRDLRVPMPKPVLPVRIPEGPLRGHISAVRALTRILRSGSYDLLHAHGLRAGMDGTLAARRARVPAVVTLHNLIMPDVSGGLRARAFGWVEPFVVRASTKTFVPSSEMGTYLSAKSNVPEGRIEVLHAGAGEPPSPRRSIEEVRAELGISGDDRLVVAVARLHPQKALDVMVDAVASLPANVTLAVVGDGPLRRDLEIGANRLGLGDRVRFLSFRDDVADYIAAAHVFCLSSLWEAIPLAAQEAVLLGVPIVSTRVGGLPELITDAVSGRLVPKNDARALAKALEETLSDDALQRRFAAAARSHYDEHFSRAAVLGRLERLYLDETSAS